MKRRRKKEEEKEDKEKRGNGSLQILQPDGFWDYQKSLDSNWSRCNKRNRDHMCTIPIIILKTHLVSSDPNYCKVTRSIVLCTDTLT